MPTNKYIIDVKSKGAKKAEQNIKGVNNSLSGLAKKAGAAAGVFFAAKGLISGMSAIIDSAREQELAEKKLETALGKVSNELLKQASALQKQTIYGDEAILSGQAFLAQMGLEESAIKKLTPAILDMASAKGMDLNAAFDLVSKTMGSSTNALSRYGLEVEGAVGSDERLSTMLSELNDKFYGQAEASAYGLGSITQMNNAIGDLAESLGNALSPLIVSVTKGIQGITEGLIGWVDASPVEEIMLEQTELNILAKSLTDVVDNEAQRDYFVGEINKKYPNFLQGMREEDITAGNIALRLKEQNDQYERKFKILQLQQIEQENAKELSGLLADVTEKRIALNTIIENQPTVEELAKMSDVAVQRVQNKLRIELAEATEELNEAQAEYDIKNEKLRERVTIARDLLETEERHLETSQQGEMDLMENRDTSAVQFDKIKVDEKNTIEAQIKVQQKLQAIKEKQVISDLKNAALSGQGAIASMKSVVRAETMEAVAGYLSGVLKSVPFPLNIGLAAAGGGIVAGLMDAALGSIPNKFAEGGDFITSGATPILVGEAGREHVQITNLDKPDGGSNSPSNGIVVNISAPLVDETVIDYIIPAINNAQRMGLA
jgi:hypothetical protein